MFRFSPRRFLFSLSLVFFMHVSLAAFPVNEDVQFTGGGTNSTFSAEWVGRLTLNITDSGDVTGFIDADGLPNGITICGSGNLSGSRNGSNIVFSYTSSDPDPGCSFDQGRSRTYKGRLSEDEATFHGKYFISNGQHGSFSFTTEARKEEWGNLDALKSHYEKNKGKPEAAYIHQVYCLAETSCKNYETFGNSGWSSGFVKHIFDSIRQPDGLFQSTKEKCHEGQSGDDCLENPMGRFHGANELLGSFLSFCSSVKNETQLTAWRDDHNSFINNAVIPCFDVVSKEGELTEASAESFKITVAHRARVLRELAINRCIKTKPWILTNIFDDKRMKLPELDIEDRNLLFSSVLESSGNLFVKFEQDAFILPVGSRINIETWIDVEGELSIIPANEVSYVIDENSKKYFEISNDGIITVVRKPIPVQQSIIGLSFRVEHNDTYGYGQFAISDDDTDGDDLVDSYEKEHGLNRFFANSDDRDSDGDTLPDQFEALYGTHPKKKDTDGDGYSDGFEYNLKSKPLDPDCNPIDGCKEEEPVESETPVEPDQPTTDTDTPTDTDTESPPPQDDYPADTNSDSGGGGGAAFWLSFALFLLLVVRQFYHHRKL